MENETGLHPAETMLAITEQQRHIFALQREVRLLNRALGRKKRKINRLRSRLDEVLTVNGVLINQVDQLLNQRARLIAFPPESMTLDQAFTEHEARLEAGAQADPAIEVGGTTHGTREHGA